MIDPSSHDLAAPAPLATPDPAPSAPAAELPFEASALEPWLRAHLPGFAGPLQIEKFPGGQSNPTYRLRTPQHDWVLRSKPGPAAKLLPSAHAIEREFRLMRALADTAVPVPRMELLCADEAVIGRAFYLMEYVPGRILWEQALPGLSAAQRRAHYLEMNRVLAALHRVDVQAVGLADYGKPGNYFERQIARWTRQYVDAKTDEIPAMDALIEKLPARIPKDQSVSIAHGDYRLENVMFHPTENRIVAVLDWELSTIGHPLADIAYNGFIWRSHSPGWGSLDGVDFKTSGIPTEAEYVAKYCERTGRGDIEDWPFLMAFSIFRLASISQGVYRRILGGNSAREGEAINGCRPLAEQALAILEGRE